MIRNVWAVLCRDIITDQESNAVTYIRCIEEGVASSLPVHIGPVFVGTLWEKTGEEPEPVSFRLILISPDRKGQVVLQTRPVILDRPWHRLQFRLNVLHLADYGMHALLVEFNRDEKWEAAARLPVFIRKSE